MVAVKSLRCWRLLLPAIAILLSASQLAAGNLAAPPGPAVSCERYTILTRGDDLAAIAATFGTTVAGLRELNPLLLGEGGAELATPGVGSPLCVVGTVLPPDTGAAAAAAGAAAANGAAVTGSTARGAQHPSGGGRGKRVGRRPASTVTLVTTPGVHTCYDIVLQAQPPLDWITFVTMNPTLDCSKLPDQASTVYLPKGTKVGGKKTAALLRGAAVGAAGRRDCVVGPWGDWTQCGVGGTQLRFRTTYQEPSGGGAACPPTSESRPCDTTNTTNTSSQQGPSRRMALAAEQCPAGVDGCSVPDRAPYYHLFVPACNLHDICYSCNRHPGWEFATKVYCDKDVFYAKMKSTCSSYWSGKLQLLDRSYCLTLASAYWIAVTAKGNPDGYENPPNPNLWADGCFWKPWDPEVNNAKGGGYRPDWAGCPCDGTSCQVY